MKISRHYTTPNQSPYAEIEFRLSKSEIRNPNGSMVFSLDAVEVPLDWIANNYDWFECPFSKVVFYFPQVG